MKKLCVTIIAVTAISAVASVSPASASSSGFPQYTGQCHCNLFGGPPIPRNPSAQDCWNFVDQELDFGGSEQCDFLLLGKDLRRRNNPSQVCVQQIEEALNWLLDGYVQVPACPGGLQIP